METKGKGVLLCVLSGMLLFAGVVMLSSCGGGKSSQSGPTLEGAKQAFETYIQEMQHGNAREAVRTRCRGTIKENMQNTIAMMDLMGGDEAPEYFKNYKGVVKAELLPDYSDIALIVADLGDGGELMSYVLHFDVSEEWKIYYAESKDLTLIKGFINDEMLQSIGIFTITDSEAEDYLN